MRRHGGIQVRTGLVFAGAATLVIGIVVFFVAIVGAGQAAAAFLNCFSGYPTPPIYTVPNACTNAMGAMAMYQGLEVLGGVLGVVGLVLLVIGIALQPEGRAPTPMYPPPVYAPPYVPPPQIPRPPQP